MKIFKLTLALVCLCLSLTLLIWGFWPPRRVTAAVPLVTPAGAPSLPGRTIRLTFSPVMRFGDSQVVELDLSAGGDSSPDYDVVAEARLDLSPAHLRPAGVVSEALADGRGARFYWEVSLREAGALRGTAWLFLRFVPKAGGEETRQAVSAQLVEIRARSMLGRTGSEARALGVGGTLAGLIVLLWARPANVRRADE